MFSQVVIALEICTNCTNINIVTQVSCNADQIIKTSVNGSALTTLHNSSARMLHSGLPVFFRFSKSAPWLASINRGMLEGELTLEYQSYKQEKTEL